MARSPKVTEAARHIRAVELEDGEWAYYDDGTRRWYLVDSDDLENLYDYLHSDDSRIASDAYSHWCASTTSDEQPEGWEPSIPEQRSTSY